MIYKVLQGVTGIRMAKKFVHRDGHFHKLSTKDKICILVFANSVCLIAMRFKSFKVVYGIAMLLAVGLGLTHSTSVASYFCANFRIISGQGDHCS